MKLVKIEWLDHVSFTEQIWRDDEEYEDLEPITVISVGQVLKETEDYIVLILCFHKGNDGYKNKYSGDIMILKKCIKSIKELR